MTYQGVILLGTVHNCLLHLISRGYELSMVEEIVVLYVLTASPNAYAAIGF